MGFLITEFFIKGFGCLPAHWGRDTAFENPGRKMIAHVKCALAQVASNLVVRINTPPTGQAGDGGTNMWSFTNLLISHRSVVLTSTVTKIFSGYGASGKTIYVGFPTKSISKSGSALFHSAPIF